MQNSRPASSGIGVKRGDATQQPVLQQEQQESQNQEEIVQTQIQFIKMPEPIQVVNSKDTKQAASQQQQQLQITQYISEVKQTIKTVSADLLIYQSYMLQDSMIVVLPQQQANAFTFKLVGNSPIHVFFYSIDTLSLMPVDLTETLLNQVTQQIYTKDYIQQADTLRKQFNHVQAKVQTIDTSKILYGNQMRLALQQNENTKAKKGVIEVVTPQQQLNNLLNNNKIGQFDQVLQEDVMSGVPVDPKAKKPQVIDKNQPQKGYLAKLIEQQLQNKNGIERSQFINEIVIQEKIVSKEVE